MARGVQQGGHTDILLNLNMVRGLIPPPHTPWHCFVMGALCHWVNANANEYQASPEGGGDCMRALGIRT
jgi:hypothetical protein